MIERYVNVFILATIQPVTQTCNRLIQQEEKKEGEHKLKLKSLPTVADLLTTWTITVNLIWTLVGWLVVYEFMRNEADANGGGIY